MEKTIFQKIIDREIPATILYEDADAIAFLDIHPVAKGHTLLVPKKHYTWFDDMPDDELGVLFAKAKTIAKAMKKGLPCDFVQITVVGKDVPHVHVHLMPRNFNDGMKTWDTLTYAEGEVQTIAEKIKKGL